MRLQFDVRPAALEAVKVSVAGVDRADIVNAQSHALLPKNLVIFWDPGALALLGLLCSFWVALILFLSIVAFFAGGLSPVEGGIFRFSCELPLTSLLSCFTAVNGPSVFVSSFAMPFCCALAKKLAMLDLFSLLLRGMMNDGELLPTLPTSLLTGYTSSSPSKGLSSACSSRLHSCWPGLSHALILSEPGLKITGMRSWRNLSCLLESVVMMV